jgi:GST-like protein
MGPGAHARACRIVAACLEPMGTTAMSITFYAWNTPNGRKISVALEEMSLPYEVKPINIGKGEQFEESFLSVSPNNKIPAIVDHDTDDGQPLGIFESGAILYYLADKTGKFMPKDARGRSAVMQWLMWQMGGFGPIPGQVHHFIALADENARAYGLERFQKETARLYGVLDRRLGEVEFVAGDLSIADFAILGWAWRHPRHKVDLAAYPNVQRWYTTLMERPAVKRGFEVKLD